MQLFLAELPQVWRLAHGVPEIPDPTVAGVPGVPESRFLGKGATLRALPFWERAGYHLSRKDDAISAFWSERETAQRISASDPASADHS